jgi:hypothetical protein
MIISAARGAFLIATLVVIEKRVKKNWHFAGGPLSSSTLLILVRPFRQLRHGEKKLSQSVDPTAPLRLQ